MQVSRLPGQPLQWVILDEEDKALANRQGDNVQRRQPEGHLMEGLGERASNQGGLP